MLYSFILAEVDDEVHASFFAYMGITAAIVFSNLGSAYGTAKTGVGICSMSVLRPELMIKSVIPVVMAGILGIYGLIIGVIIQMKITTKITFQEGYKFLGAGLCCGLTSLAAGLALGIVGDAGVRANAQ